MIVVVDSARLVAKARNVHDPSTLSGCEDLVHDEIGEQEVANVVGSKLHFDAVGSGGVILDCHDCDRK